MISRREFVQESMALTIMPTIKISKKEYSKTQKNKWKLGITNLDKALKGGIHVKPYPSSMIMINTTDNNDFIDALDNTIPYQQPVENQYPIHIHKNSIRSTRYFIFAGEKESPGYPAPYQHNLLNIFNGKIGKNKEIIIYFDPHEEYPPRIKSKYMNFTSEHVYDYISVITNGTKKNTFNWKLMKITDRHRPMFITRIEKKCDIVMTGDQKRIIDLKLKINDKKKLEEI